MKTSPKPLEPYIVVRTSNAFTSPSVKLLRNGGYLVSRVTDDAECVRLLRCHDPAALVIDLPLSEIPALASTLPSATPVLLVAATPVSLLSRKVQRLSTIPRSMLEDDLVTAVDRLLWETALTSAA